MPILDSTNETTGISKTKPKIKHILIKKPKYSFALNKGSMSPSARPIKNLKSRGRKK
jgi:hypothetical protein